jgi:hypothetical protein
MNCYVCEKTPGPSGTRYHIKAAVGICHNCGVGICAEHSHKDVQPGAPLLCPACAKLLNETPDGQPANHTVMRQN